MTDDIQVSLMLYFQNITQLYLLMDVSGIRILDAPVL